MIIAGYARHSSDLQNQRSTQDQLDALGIVAQARGCTRFVPFMDVAISGAAITNRPGLQALLRAAERGEVQLVLTEALDRLSRDQEGTAHIFKRLKFHGIVLETLSEGRISELHVGLSGTMNQLFLVALADKTRRGLMSKVREGFSGGGRCYGYRIIAKGVLEIDEQEAVIVIRIYRDYANGVSPRAIAHALNAEGVPGPRGETWTPSTINGDRRTGDGILHQELYIGMRVFNRRKFRKHPDTGRRSSTLNPPEQWIREAVPELRIVDDALWAKVQARKGELSAQPAAYARAPKRLLSGLLKCGLCGAGMTLNGGKYACSAHRERGTCSNGKIIAARTVEERVLAGVRDKLLTPAAVAEALRTMRETLDEEHRAAVAERLPIERELAQVARRLDRAQQMCMDIDLHLALEGDDVLAPRDESFAS